MSIRLENLAIAYGANRVIDGLSLDIPQGCFFTLLGPSGCGKTTLLRAIAGFLPIAAGRLSFGAADVTLLPAHKRDIGMVFQDYALFPDRSAFENVAYGLRARKVAGADLRQRVGRALERVGLAGFGERLPAALSGGQRQRVALARALVIEPRVLLMDEPLSNLDAKLRVQVRETIADLQREAGITTVFVTHDQDEALALSDQIGVMKAGRLEQIGAPEDIYGRPASGYVADFVGAANLLPLPAGAGMVAAGPVTLSYPFGAIAAQAPRAVAASEAVLVARPEEIDMQPAATALSSDIPARVQRRRYLGAKTHYTLALAGGLTLALESARQDHDAVPLGADVRLRFDPAKTWILPR